MATGGSTMPIINKSAFENIKIIMPKKTVLTNFNNLFIEINIQLETNILENQELTNLRDTLLPKLISGELEVSEVKEG
jgi:type I restriction enzyme S subunit